MIHQIVIPSAANNSVFEKAYVNGRCKIKIISVYFTTSRTIENGDSYIADRLYILQSAVLFQGIPNTRLIVATASNNSFDQCIEHESIVNGLIDLTILEADTLNKPSDVHFESMLLTVDITPIA
jgi:hypothetical protein